MVVQPTCAVQYSSIVLKNRDWQTKETQSWDKKKKSLLHFTDCCCPRHRCQHWEADLFPFYSGQRWISLHFDPPSLKKSWEIIFQQMYPGTKYTGLSLPWMLPLDFQGKVGLVLFWKQPLHGDCASSSTSSPLMLQLSFQKCSRLASSSSDSIDSSMAVPGYIFIVIPTLHLQWAFVSPFWGLCRCLSPVSIALIGLVQQVGCHQMVLVNNKDIWKRGDTNKCFYFSTEKFYT
jgi:hypothetical protein